MVHSNLMCLRKLGIRINSENARNYRETEIVNFNNLVFLKLFHFDFEILLTDISRNKDFSLKVVPPTATKSRKKFKVEKVSEKEEQQQYLVIGHSPRIYRNCQRDSRVRLLKLSFQNVNEDSTFTTVETEEHIENLSLQKHFYITSKLYSLLRDFHSGNDKIHANVPESVQHEILVPTLRDYQKKAVRWLIHQEISKESLPNLFISVKSYEQPEEIFVNIGNLEIIYSNPGTTYTNGGGILADEMGLGKTVEMLALILHNKRKDHVEYKIWEKPRLGKRTYKDFSDEDDDDSGDDESEQIDDENNDSDEEFFLPNSSKRRKCDSKNNILCICYRKTKRNTIRCSMCCVNQHVKCVRKHSTEKFHICPSCWEKETDKAPIESHATIIVSPEPIKLQWYTEIQRHTNRPLKLLLYPGVSQKFWISPKELAAYDIVLTDYNILQKEIYFKKSNRHGGNLRCPKKYMQISSPLLMVKWWRVCLDEAQLVESPTAKTSQMARELPAIHRWAVTGTPIQKSIDDLKGLLDFLNLYPFNDNLTFKFIVSLFQQGDTKLLIEFLSKILWRTCKSSVLDQLGIPPQKEEVHYVNLSDAQMLFYNSQRQLCATAFEERAKKVAESSTILSKIDPKTISVLLEPLRKLRQDCTVPVLLQRSDENVVKRLLEPAELLEHLKSTNEIECKSQLRTIASSFNGIASIHFINGNFDEAIKYYEMVMRRAKEHTGTICVDSLLQIHALHNLIAAHEAKGTPQDEIADLTEQCEKLEWKYIETYRNSYKKAEQSYKAVLDAILELEDKLPMRKLLGDWWRNLFNEFEEYSLEDQLFVRINEEKRTFDRVTMHSDFNTFHGLDYLLTTWVDKLFSARREVIQAFNQFRVFTNQIKPKSEIPEDKLFERKEFIKVTFDCHLKNLINNMKKKKKKKSKNTFDEELEQDEEEITEDFEKKICYLCRAKKALTQLECILFRKVLDEATEITKGAWNPTLQEKILKITSSFAKMKNIGENHTRDGEAFLQLLDAMKREYKEFGKVWIETEYTVKAYDELDMCKMRLQAIDSDSLRQSEMDIAYNISREEVDSMLQQFNTDVKAAEMEFIRKSARLKYLKHLESKSDPEACPICSLLPEEKYCVLECGHHMCIQCLMRVSKYQRFVLNCAICRNKQSYHNVYYVTCKPQTDTINSLPIKGHYSAKVEEIVRTILRLRNHDNEVKILIFSHWEKILQWIANALLENDIKFTMKSSKSKSINEFKDLNLGITCLLLLLAHGSKGLNLTEATHVFLVEPILNPGEELQAIGRVHRIGQTRTTTVHRFICKNTIEEKIFNTVCKDECKKWEFNDVTIENVRNLFAWDENTLGDNEIPNFDTILS